MILSDNSHNAYVLDFVKQASAILKDKPFVSALIAIMILDVLAGVCVAATKRTLNSTVSTKGMMKKAFILILVGMGAILSPFAQDVPLDRFIAVCFMFSEAISITENAAALGLAVPQWLVDILQKNREDQQKKIEQKMPTAKMTIPLEPGTETEVTVTKTPAPAPENPQP